MQHKFKVGDTVKLKHFPPKPIGGWQGSFLDYFKDIENKFKVTGLGTYNFTGKQDLCISINLPNYNGFNPEEAFELYEQPKGSLIGRFLKALIDTPNGTDYKKNEDILICDEYPDLNRVNCTKGFVFSHENYDFTQSDVKLMPEDYVSNHEHLKEIQKICKEKYPIGCIFKPVNNSSEIELLNDECTYYINEPCKSIWAHNGNGLLYENGQWAELVSYPKEPGFKVGDYVKVIAESDGWGDIEYVNIPIKQDLTLPHTKEQAFDSPVLLNKSKKQNKIIVL